MGACVTREIKATRSSKILGTTNYATGRKNPEEHNLNNTKT